MLKCDFCSADIVKDCSGHFYEMTHLTTPFSLDIIVELENGETKAIKIDFSSEWLACSRCHKDICELNKQGLLERAIKNNPDSSVAVIHELFWLNLIKRG